MASELLDDCSDASVGPGTEDPRLHFLPPGADYHHWINTPRSSPHTHRSLDSSLPILQNTYPIMDAEDSPWGGTLRVCSMPQAWLTCALDVPSQASPDANDTKATAGEQQGAFDGSMDGSGLY